MLDRNASTRPITSVWHRDKLLDRKLLAIFFDVKGEPFGFRHTKTTRLKLDDARVFFVSESERFYLNTGEGSCSTPRRETHPSTTRWCLAVQSSSRCFSQGRLECRCSGVHDMSPLIISTVDLPLALLGMYSHVQSTAIPRRAVAIGHASFNSENNIFPQVDLLSP